MTEVLDRQRVQQALEELPGWSYEGDRLRRAYRFRSFGEALAFLVRVGVEAEKRDHHPELHNSYDRVTVELTSHDAGGVTERDLALARAIEGFAPAGD